MINATEASEEEMNNKVQALAKAMKDRIYLADYCCYDLMNIYDKVGIKYSDDYFWELVDFFEENSTYVAKALCVAFHYDTTAIEDYLNGFYTFWYANPVTREELL